MIMNTKQMRDSIQPEWPIEVRFLIEKGTSDIDQCMREIQDLVSDFYTFEKRPWWKKIGKRKKHVSILKEGLDKILSEQKGNEKETEN